MLPEVEKAPEPPSADETKIKAVLEAIIYVTEEPLTKAQISGALGAPLELVERLLAELSAEFEKPEHGLAVREVAGTSHRLPSGPLHDAAEVSRAGVPTAMLFVQSLRGLSHTKLEDTKPEHLELAVQALDRLATKTLGWATK